MTHAPPRINGIAQWAGAKRKLAGRIVREMPTHKVYVEPFMGSMAVLLDKPESDIEIANDLHGHLVNLARVIQGDDAPILHERLSRCLFGEDTLRQSELALSRWDGAPQVFGGDIERAFHYHIVSWMGRGDASGTTAVPALPVRYTATGGSPTVRFRSAVESIPAWHTRLKNVVITHGDGFEVIGKVADKPNTLLYLDPPYLDKSFSYCHDFLADDHRRLADALGSLKEARALVSYYDDPRLEDLFPRSRWRRIDLTTTKHSGNSSARGEREAIAAPEVLLANWSNP